MAVGTILTILFLSIVIPTADVFTDVILAVKLYKPLSPPRCKYYVPSHDGDRLSWIYKKCEEDPVFFCSNHGNREHCVSNSNTATVLLMPCLLNYIVCFYTFFRLTTNRKKYLFIFPLLNLYPQYGKTHLS